MNIPPGKLPACQLREFLHGVQKLDSSVLVGPAIGEDAAVIDVGASDLVVVASDPITFADADLGTHVLAVNGNDLAVMGAEPRWLLTTVLMPEGTVVDEVRTLMSGIDAACAAEKVTLVGGHTEVTRSVRSPIVIGTLLGTVAPDKLVQTSGAEPSDVLILAGEIAIEGTAILARDYDSALRAQGVNSDDILEAAKWLTVPGISVRTLARALRESIDVHSMHDPTEGGIVATLHELAEAADVGLIVDRDAVPVLPACRRICDVLGLDPYALLASGALLAAVPASSVDESVAVLHAAGASASVIGQVAPVDEGRTWTINGRSRLLPEVSRDELARYLDLI